MNPIHEAGFASLFVLAFASAPGALFSLLSVVFARWKPNVGLVLAGLGALCTALVLCLAAITTIKLHGRVDYWIDLGSYGPAAEVHRTYGPEWHASARLTALVGLVFAAVPLLLSFVGYWRARGKEKPGTVAFGIGFFVAVALVWDGFMAVV